MVNKGGGIREDVVRIIRMPYLCIWNCKRIIRLFCLVYTKPWVKYSESHTPSRWHAYDSSTLDQKYKVTFSYISEASLDDMKHSHSGEGI